MTSVFGNLYVMPAFFDTFRLNYAVKAHPRHCQNSNNCMVWYGTAFKVSPNLQDITRLRRPEPVLTGPYIGISHHDTAPISKHTIKSGQ